MDRRTLLAIVLSALVLIFVPMLLDRLGLLPTRAPEPTRQAEAPGGPGAPGDTAGRTAPGPQAPDRTGAPTALPEARPGAPGLVPGAAAPDQPLAGVSAAPERRIHVSGPLYDAEFNSRGARLVGVTLKKFKGGDHEPVRLEGSPTAWLDLGDQIANRLLSNSVYEVSESTDAEGFPRRLRFSLADSAGLRVTQTYTLDPQTYVMDLEVRMDGVLQRGFSDYHIGLRSWPLMTERNEEEDLRNLQVVNLVGKDVKRHNLNNLRKESRLDEGAVRWTAVRSKYFTVAAIPEQASSKAARSYVPPDADMIAPGTSVQGAQVGTGLVLPVPPSGMAHHLLIYAGPSDYWMLKKLGHRLEDVVELGWRWILPFAHAILYVLVFLQKYLLNYGVVIIVLSALVKLVFHPLTASSMKSMRAMQRIQPEVEKVRKRYEKDPQKMNKAVFDLYKEHKISPLGGCLPLLIQMPVLFALYQVFLHAIELRQAPFVFWINDLSAPDVLFEVAGFPIRILPIIMFASSLLQQKLTPTDPRQVTTMYIMNVFMLVLFYNLPSGLVLYWTVTNLLTAIQQYIIAHGEQPAPQAASA